MDSTDDSDAFDSDLEENLDLIEDVQRLPYQMKPKSNPLDLYSDRETVSRFRFRKQTIMDLLAMVQEPLTRHTQKSINIPPILQLLIALRFYAAGHFQLLNGDLHNVSQGSISKIIATVSKAISSLHQRYIKFPTHDEAPHFRESFQQISNFPGVTGAIDCTHIRIRSPGGPTAELYRNRKTYFSINVQAVCDSTGKFTNFSARWPGSVHDARIFDNSHLRAQLGSQEIPGLLVGDAGYPCLSFLMTPLRNPVTETERRYNASHIKARNPIERAFGVLKKRFYCLGSELRTKLKTSLAIISACFVLHNLAKERGEEEPEPLEEDHDDSLCATVNISGNAARRLLIQTYFTT